MRLRLLLGRLFLCKMPAHDATADSAKNGVMTRHMTRHGTHGRTLEASRSIR